MRVPKALHDTLPYPPEMSSPTPTARSSPVYNPHHLNHYNHQHQRPYIRPYSNFGFSSPGHGRRQQPPAGSPHDVVHPSHSSPFPNGPQLAMSSATFSHRLHPVSDVPTPFPGTNSDVGLSNGAVSVNPQSTSGSLPPGSGSSVSHLASLLNDAAERQDAGFGSNRDEAATNQHKPRIGINDFSKSKLQQKISHVRKYMHCSIFVACLD